MISVRKDDGADKVQAAEPRLALTRDEAARAMRISVSKLDQLARAGQVRSRKVGARVLYPVAWLNEFLTGE